MKTFCTAGPVRPDDHYSIPALSRWDIDEIHRLIEEKRYFVLHAPRQTGKITLPVGPGGKTQRARELCSSLCKPGTCPGGEGDMASGMRIIFDTLVASADQHLEDQILPEISREIVATQTADSLLREGLRRWCRRIGKPLVLLLDEVDSLVGDTLISLLRQIRAGYTDSG